jgi:hypothetical protein
MADCGRISVNGYEMEPGSGEEYEIGSIMIDFTNWIRM